MHDRTKHSRQRLSAKDRLRAFAGSLFRARVRKQSRRFLKAAEDCRKTQHGVLRRLLALNEASRFSQEHGLTSTLTLNEFRTRLPISDYERFRPYIERLKVGDTQALLGPQNKLLMFTLSSGTTSDSKFIPITQQFLDDYRRGWQIWGIHAYDARPGLNHKNILQVASDFNRYCTPAGTPCGNISGLAVASQRPIVRFMYTIPYAVSKIDNPLAKYYTILRLGLADDNIGLITTANPSTLVQLATLADAEKESLIRDIADGTLSNRFAINDEVRQRLQRRLSRRRPKRARELEALADAAGTLRLSDAWPRLEQLAIWMGGSCAAYLSAIKQHFGDQVPIRDHGLSASEGRMTIPFNEDRSDGVLDVMSHYFEFIPEGEHGSANPSILEAHELCADQNYFILLTTSSGLYRYDICDVVRCTGFVGTTPILRFLHKGAHISNLTGEKVSESQVVEAVRHALDTIHHRVGFFTLTPVWGERPYYQLLLEARDTPPLQLGEQLVSAIDNKLQELNCEYQEKRSTGRLGPLRLTRLADGSWRQFAEQRQTRLGGSIEQYKHLCLMPDLEAVARAFGDQLRG
ncbi:MAG: GH3 auxin-responsive promoter family protein [Planctomycetaceae bacterium]|nr:GH3 auxin-responsive promoter family protein [Planctomycetaceae bacterium]